MTYSPDLYHRRSIRLRGYDYSHTGLYFVTICTRNRACLFGKVVGGMMVPNLAGVVIEQWWHQLPNRYPGVGVDAAVVTPNYIHGIVVLGAGNGEASLSHLVQWFKSITTADYRRAVTNLNWPPFNGRLWQRNYNEHIIRTDVALARIHAYIAANPANWDADTENPTHPRLAATEVGLWRGWRREHGEWT